MELIKYKVPESFFKKLIKSSSRDKCMMLLSSVVFPNSVRTWWCQSLQSKYWISNNGWGQTDEAAERLSAMMPASRNF